MPFSSAKLLRAPRKVQAYKEAAVGLAFSAFSPAESPPGPLSGGLDRAELQESLKGVAAAADPDHLLLCTSSHRASTPAIQSWIRGFLQCRLQTRVEQVSTVKTRFGSCDPNPGQALAKSTQGRARGLLS